MAVVYGNWAEILKKELGPRVIAALAHAISYMKIDHWSISKLEMGAVSDAVPDFLPRRFIFENRSLVHSQIGNGRSERCRTGFSTSPFHM